VLYALGHPASFVVLVASYVLGVTLHGWVQALVASRLGDARVRHDHRLQFNPRQHVDPFGALGALIGGVGWAVPVDLPGRRDRRRSWLVGLAGPLANILLGVGLLLLFRFLVTSGTALAIGATWAHLGDTSFAGSTVPVSVTAGGALQHGVALSGGAAGAAGIALLLVGLSQLYLGVFSLLPIPPLSGGRLLLALAPHSLGWQRARHYLVEQNIGIAVLIVLLVLPLGGRLLVLYLLDSLLAPLLRVLLGV
jgi:Zn-dependent protease